VCSSDLIEEFYGLHIDKIVDEIADVTIMMEQLALIYGYGDVQRRIKFKHDRLAERVDPDLTADAE
jgi:hypothetical protein